MRQSNPCCSVTLMGDHSFFNTPSPPPLFLKIISPPPPYKYRGRGVILELLGPSVVLSVCPIVSCWYLLNRSTIFYQNWCAGVLSRGDVSCWKICPLSSVSRSQWEFVYSKLWLFLLYWITVFKIKVTVKVQNVVNVCADDILWTTEHFVTKPGKLMQHRKPGWRAEKLVHCV